MRWIVVFWWFFSGAMLYCLCAGFYLLYFVLSEDYLTPRPANVPSPDQPSEEIPR